MKIRLLFEERAFTIEIDSTATCRQLLNRACHMLYPGRVRMRETAHVDVRADGGAGGQGATEDGQRGSERDDEAVRAGRDHVPHPTEWARKRCESVEKFCDGPKVLPCPSYNYAPGTRSAEEATELGSYLFTNFEAGKMKTWIVKKITSKQKLRKRIMVVDRDEVFINHVSFWKCSSCSTRSQIYIDIASINSIVMERDPPNSFTIKFTDDYYSEDEEPAAENSRCGEFVRSRYDGGAEVHCRE